MIHIPFRQFSSSILYRALFAEDLATLSDPLGRFVSTTFEVIIYTDPPVPVPMRQNIVLCGRSDNDFISVSVPNGVMVNWYDEPAGGNLLLSDSAEFYPNVSGTYYAESVLGNNCISPSRAQITLDFDVLPIIANEELTLCAGEQMVLNANIPNMDYLWNTGETHIQYTSR